MVHCILVMLSKYYEVDLHAHTHTCIIPTLNQTLVHYVEANMASCHCDTDVIWLEYRKRDRVPDS